MSWKIYKPGQGYWTRVMSAIGAGVLILAGGLWTGQQMDALRGDWVIYVKTGLMIAIFLVFGLMAFRFFGTAPRTADFLIATEGEMKKVNWPPRREVIGSTQVVLLIVTLLMLLLLVSDLVLIKLLVLSGVLEKFN